MFYDADGDFILDPGEVSTVTDDNGRYNLTGFTRTEQGQIVVLPGGVDTETGNRVGLLASPDGGQSSGIITPITLLLALNPDLSQEQLKQSLGIPQNVDLKTFDPVAAMDTGDAAAAKAGEAVFAAQQQIFTVIQTLSTAASGSSGTGDTRSLTEAVSAVGAAISSGATGVNQIATQATSTVVTDSAKAEALAGAINATNNAIGAAYQPTSGISLSEARRAVSSTTASEEEKAAAVARLAEAKATASVSQTTLQTVTNQVATSTNANAVADQFKAQLQTTLNTKTESFTKVVQAQVAGNAGVVDGLPAYLVSQVRNASSTEAKVVLDLASAVSTLSLNDIVALNIKSVVLQGGGSAVEISLGSTTAASSVGAGAFADSYQVTLSVSASEFAQVVQNAARLQAAGVDSIKAVGGTLSVSVADAKSLIASGLKFAEGSVQLAPDSGLSAADVFNLVVVGGLKFSGTVNITGSGLQDLSVNDALTLVAAGVRFPGPQSGDPFVVVTPADLAGSAAVYVGRLQTLADAGLEFKWPTGLKADNPGLSPTALDTLTKVGVQFATSNLTATVSLSDSDLKAGETSVVTFTFSAPVQGFTLADVTAPRGALTNLSAGTTNPDGTQTYTATFTPAVNVDAASAAISVRLTGVTSGGSPGQGTATSANYTVDTLRPTATITLSDSTLTRGETSTVTITFAQAVNGFSIDDLSVENGALSNLVQSTTNPLVWTATYTPTANVADTTNVVSLNLAGVTDASSTAAGVGAASSANYTVDTRPVTATITLGDRSLTAGETTQVTIEFTEPLFVSGPLADALNFAAQGVAIKSAGFISVANGVITNLGLSGDRTLTGIFTPDQNIEDTSNVITVDLSRLRFERVDPFTGRFSSPGEGTVTSANYTVDTLRPTAEITLSDRELITGETSTVTITFAQPVSGFTLDDLAAENGTLANLSAARVNANGSVSYTATFTPTANIADTTNAVTLNLAGVTDTSSTAAGVGSAASPNYAVNTQSVTASIAVADTRLTAGETTTVTITFSQPVSGFTLSALTAPSGALSNLAQSTTNPLVWTATLTPTANIEDTSNLVRLDLTQVVGVESNTAGVGSVTSPNYIVDTLQPTATVTIADTALTAGETTTVTITFAQPVSGFTIDDLSAENGALSNLAQSTTNPLVWTATFTPTANVEDTSNLVAVNLAGITDTSSTAAGVGSATSANYTVDTLRPTATVTIADTALTAGETTTVTITFAQPVSGFTLDDLSAENGALSNLAQSTTNPLVWTATLTPTANIKDTTNVVTLNLAEVTDTSSGAAGIGSATSANYTVDSVVATATISIADRSLTAGESTQVTIAFTEPLASLTPIFTQALSPISAANGTLTDIQIDADQKIVTATFTPTADIEDTTNVITVDLSRLSFSKEETSPFTGIPFLTSVPGTGTVTSDNYTIDTLRPTATVAISDTALTAGETATVTITFSQAVSGFTIEDLTAQSGTLSNLQQDSVNPLVWTATLTPTANLTDVTNVVSVNLAGVTDASSNTGLGTVTSPNYTVISGPPTATIAIADTALTAGETTTVTITFSQVVSGFTLADLTAPSGALSDLVQSTSNPLVWTATFTPTANIEDTTNVISLALSGVTDAASNPGTGTAESDNYTVDTLRPTATIALSATSLNVGDTATVTITFSQAVSGFTLDDLVAESGSLSAFTVTSNPAVYTATFTASSAVTDSENLITLNLSGVTDSSSGAAGIDSVLSPNYSVTVPPPPPPPSPSSQTPPGLYDITSADMATFVGSTPDNVLDTFVAGRITAGFDGVLLDASEIATLADQAQTATDMDFAMGTDVVINGTSFLSTSGVTTGELRDLLGDADVTARLSASDASAILATGGVGVDARLDDLVSRLSVAGVDSLELTQGQFQDLANAGASFTRGADVILNLDGSSGTGEAATNAEALALLRFADVDARIGSTDMTPILAGNDATLDARLDALEARGVDRFEFTDTQIGELATRNDVLTSGDYDFDAGTDIVINGTSFLSVSGVDAGDLRALFGDADVTVRMTASDFGAIVGATNQDAALDSLVNRLTSAGVDQIEFDSGQILRLAQGALTSSVDFNAGADIVINGASFVDSGTGVGADQLRALLGVADVDVRIDASDFATLTTDTALDTLTTRLTEAGVDRIEFDAGQIAQLADQALTSTDMDFASGTDIVINGTSFLSAPGVTISELQALLQDADVTVRLPGSDFREILAGGDGALDNLVSRLLAVGVDQVEFESGQIINLAAPGTFSFAANSPITVDGAGFLDAPNDSANGVTAAELRTLLEDASVMVRLDNSDIAELRDNATRPDMLADFEAVLDSGIQNGAQLIDTIQLEAGDLRQLSDAFGPSYEGLRASLIASLPEVNSALNVDDFTIGGTSFLAPYGSANFSASVETTGDFGLDMSTAVMSALPGEFYNEGAPGYRVNLDAVSALGASNFDELREGLIGLQRDAYGAGTLHLELDDELARTLAAANVQFVNGDGLAQVKVVAQADTPEGIAYLQSSLTDMAALKVAVVSPDADVQRVEFHFGDGLTQEGADILATMPHFERDEWQDIVAIIDEPTVKSIIESEGVLGALVQSGVTTLRLDGQYEAKTLGDLEQAIGDAGLSMGVQQAPDQLAMMYELHPVSPREAELLGVNDTSSHDPFGLLHKQKV